MLKFQYSKTQEKNNQSNGCEQEFLNQMQKQQIAFKSFLSTLKKSPHRYLSSDLNPEQKKCTKDQFSYLQQSLLNDSIQKNFHSTKTKIETIQKIKNSEESPLVNFRINKIKSIQKSRYHDLSQPKSTNNTSENSKISNINQDLNRILIKTARNKISSSNKNPLSLQKNHPHIKQFLLSSSSTHQSQKLKQNIKNPDKINDKIQNKLKLQNIHSITWKPDSNSFLTKLYEQKKEINQKNQSFFLSQLLNMDVQSTIQFFKQQKDKNESQILCEGKDICIFFKQIFEINRIKTLKQPLIKKYNNCIFYGEKPNFDFTHSGAIFYFNGNAYFGSLKNFQKHGVGIEFISSKNLSDDAYRLEASQYDSQSYFVYRGNFLKNSKVGQFLINAPNYVYQGSLLKGIFQGPGTLIAQSITFNGIWSMNKKVSGHQQFKNEFMAFEGEYLDGKFHGQGKLKKADEFYEGQFEKGEKNGKGILVNQNYIYEGTFQSNRKHGKGTYFDKAQYRQQKQSQSSQNYDFGECIYDVEFRADKMIRKVEIRKQQQTSNETEELDTFKDDKSVYSTLTNDFRNIRPSNLLNSELKDKTPQKQDNFNLSGMRYQKYKQILSVIPSEPEEQQLFANRGKSYLMGNQAHLLPKRIKRDYF